jgi:GTP pyrophosphokinase
MSPSRRKQPARSQGPGGPRLGARFEEALQWAAQLHAGQRRKGTEIPYVSHLMSVAALVLEDGGDEDQAIAALLHDAVEDQGGLETREEIRRRFGDRVTAIVDGCTDAVAIPKPPWRERKQGYIDAIRTAPPEILRVSIADKLHNARSILLDYRRNGEAVWGRFNGGREGTLWYYRSLIGAFRQAGAGPNLQELERIVSELENLAAGMK